MLSLSLSYIHYRICQSWDYVYGLMTGLFASIILTALSLTYFICYNLAFGDLFRFLCSYPWLNMCYMLQVKPTELHQGKG